MDKYQVTFIFDYCTIVAYCDADYEDSAPDLAWDWVTESIGITTPLSEMPIIDIIVEKFEED